MRNVIVQEKAAHVFCCILVTPVSSSVSKTKPKQTLAMELEQLHEAGLSQEEQRKAAEKAVTDATAKVHRLEDTVRDKKALFEEADGEFKAYIVCCFAVEPR